MAEGRFGETLGWLIKKRYGNQHRFALASARSDGGVSQYVNGQELSHQVLTELLACFPDASDRDALVAAWIEDFLPAREGSFELPEAPSDEEISSYCRRIPELIAQGQILTVLSTTKRLWRSLRHEEKRSGAAFLVGAAYCETCLALDRQREGLAAAAQVLSLARERGEPAIIAGALWLQVIGGRVSFGGALRTSQEALKDLQGYLRLWQPSGPDGKDQRFELVRCAARDGLLVGLDLFDRDRSVEGLLRGRLDVFRTSFDHLPKDSDLTLCREIEARALTQLGEFEGAYQALAVAESGPLPDHPAHPVKTQISLARLYLADDQLDEAERVLTRAKAACEEQRLLHHHAGVIRLLSELSRIG